jgi:UDPglucose 6-dehydrogenase
VKVAVIGAGRVGLPTAVTLAKLGHQVGATDVDERKLEALRRSAVPFFEPGLGELLQEGMDSGRLSFDTDPGAVIWGSRVALICVGTPPLEDGRTDVSAVDAAAEAVARHADGPIVVAVKSTVPAGTVDRVAAHLRAAAAGGEFAVVSNPEFLREGKAVEDSLRPVRILVGTDSEEARTAMRELYAQGIEAGVPYVETDPRSAEVAKHACNAFLALKVSYVNALARVCEAVGADVVTVSGIMGVDARIGPSYLQAGLGFGGYCLPKDVQGFERLAAAVGYDFGLLREVQRINAEAVEAALARVRAAVGDLRGRRVALLGLSFKPGTDNVTDAPALRLARRLIEEGADPVGYDPQAAANAKATFPDLEVSEDIYAALEGAHCAVVCTEWQEVRSLDLRRALRLMARPSLVDERNVFQPGTMVEAGFSYQAAGRAVAS